MSTSNQPHKLVSLSELKAGKTRRLTFKDQQILLCRTGDEVHAVADKCTHEDISLSLGVLCEYHLRCPLHGSRFDVRTGKVLDEPAEIDLATYPVEIIDGWICISDN